MAKKFGDFLGKFLDYDASIPFLSQVTHMHIHVCLDVTTPLKRKKKIKIEEAMFVYEKLSLFCFICGKLGHGESYCPFRLRIEPSKLVLDGIYHCVRCHEGGIWCTNQCNSFNCEIDSGRIIGRDFGKQMSNPNLIPLGPNQQYFINGNNNGRNLGNSALNVDGLVNGPMEMALEEENDPIAAVEGKKWQKIIAGPLVSLGINAKCGSHDLTASSGEQSSQAQ
ncbi:hypothetical protein Godav_016808 [Gossypium davidsonii]|nr:hypothetical protein [Gossypium davidsonii]